MGTARLVSLYEWSKDAACTGQTAMFFPNEEESARDRAAREKQAKHLCKNCPVLQPCLDTAIANEERGIWGGTTERERDEMERRMRREAARSRRATPMPAPPPRHTEVIWRVVEARPDLSGVEIRLLIAEDERNWHGFQFAVHRDGALVFLADDEPDAWLYFNSLVMA